MRFAALAVDFDGTLAHEGAVPPELLQQLAKVRASGRRVILVTGRDLDELLGIFDVGGFDLVVAENGALLYRPATGERELLGPEPSPSFLEALRARGVSPIAVGHSIVATLQPHENAVLETIRDLGLELHVIFNKGAVMILPSGVNKATGLAAALAELRLSPRNVVAMGDGENDHAMLEMAEMGVAVANAIPSLRESAHRVTQGEAGQGVMELVADLLDADLGAPARRPGRSLLLGRAADGRDVCVPCVGSSVLIAGAHSGASVRFAHVLLERIRGHGYQCCVLDTTGAHRALVDAIVLGDERQAPDAAAVVEALDAPEVAVVADLRALTGGRRAAFMAEFARRVAELRRTKCRPHRLVFDDANALLPAEEPVPGGLLDLDAIYVTTEPAAIAVAALESVNAVVEVGEDTITYRKAQHDEGIELSLADEKLKRMTPPSAVARMAGGPRPAAPGH
jgi:HAD superfamily hydrolase (TIGR01484 family)